VSVGVTVAVGAGFSHPAQAATVTVPFVCLTNAYGVNYDNSITPLNVTLTAPATSNAGEVIPVTYAFPSPVSPLPFAVTGATVAPRATVTGLGPGGTALSAATADGPTLSGVTIAPFGTAPVATSITVAYPVVPNATNFSLDLVPGPFALNIQASNELTPSSSITCSPQTTNQVAATVAVTGQPVPAQTDRCVAYNANTTGGPGCATTQNVEVSLTQGRLVQRAYVNTTPAAGTGVIDGSGISAPVAGTPLVNGSATEINLGSIISPLAPTEIVGTLNDITVSDNRGGAFGWSLTADITDPDGAGALGASLNGTLGNDIPKTALSVSPTCVTASETTAWDYDAVGQTVIPGFDPTLNAPGQLAGSANQSFGASAITLCTKSTATNATTQTTGGIYNVGGTVRLLLPAFQAADKYAGVMTITLA
jgi:hypothetical protein